MSTPPGVPPSAGWERLEALFAEAVELPAAGRAAFLESACGEDAALRERLAALLEAHAALEEGDGPGSFLESLDDRASALLGEAGDDALLGAQVGRYRIERALGRGAMGRVYLAHDPALDRRVALKLLPPHLSADPAANRRLVEEARAVSALDHPHIATVFEIGETDDARLFIAMAYYEGATLRERLREGPLPVDVAVEIARGVASGLAAAHARGIIHRDIKPENLVLGADGEVRILDFGVAKVAAAALTRTGATAGTVAYMSPEQTGGGAVDARADLWSLGVVLYEMLTGERPFRGEGNDAVVYGIRHDRPEPLRRRRPEVPAGLAAVVSRCLEKEPARRFGSASLLEKALTGALTARRGPRERAAELAPLAAYAGAAAFTLLATGQADSRLLLPGWVQGAVLALLLVLGVVTMRTRGALRRRSLALGATGLAVLVMAGGLIAAGGAPRVTDARGTAGDAFGERGWVLVGDFDATEGAEDVVLAVREALSVDLQQSGFVNVVGRPQIAAILQRMGVADTTRLTGALALEVAERAGAGAVLTASVSRLGGQYVISGRALRPGSGEALFAVRAAAGPDRLLGAVESLSREMRRRLGEARDDIRRSRPLPEVSTASLAALRLYALAERLIPIDYDGAGGLVAEALRSDTAFAMGHRLAAAIAHSQLRYGDASHHLTRAFQLRERLPERERWHIEAFYHATVTFEPVRAAETYELLLQRHPDDWRAANNLAGLYQGWLDSHEAAYVWYLRASELLPSAGGPLIGALKGAFLTGREAAVDSLEGVMEERGMHDYLLRWRQAHAFARGDVARAAELCEEILPPSAVQARFATDREVCGSADVASGRLRAGSARLAAAERSYLESGRHRNVAHIAHSLAVADILRGRPGEAAAHLERVLALVPADSVPEPDRFINRTSLQVQAALLGRLDLVERIGAAYPAYPDPWHWLGRTGDGLVNAARALARDDPRTALRALRAGWPADREPMGWRIWNDLLHGMAYERLGQADSAAARYRAAADPRYHTAQVLTKNRIYLPLALERLAAAEEAAGNPAGAAEARARLRRLWVGADPEVRALLSAPSGG